MNARQAEKRFVGSGGEAVAAGYMKKLGHKVLARNFRCPAGEIDLVCEKKRKIVFVEVKSRTSKDFGEPEEAVTEAKKRKILKVAEWYLAENCLEGREVRLDVISVLYGGGGKPKITYFPGAFELE